jgi:hypothetical protein
LVRLGARSGYEIKQTVEQSIATLRAIEPTARAAEDQGNVYPMLTLRMGSLTTRP